MLALENNMGLKFSGVDTAMQILRPNATYEVAGLEIVQWNDPRPKPTTDELTAMIDAIAEFEKQNIMYVTTENLDEMVAVDSQEFLKELDSINK
jgi:hypothetical protein